MSDAVIGRSEPPSAPGPRTEAGKRRSRLNARVHGLTAALPDGAAEAAAMQQFADRWAAQLGPEVEAEEALIRSAAAAFARLERCRKAEEGALATCAQEAVDRWEKKKRHAVRRTAQGLDKDPYNTVTDLETSSFGCEWLMRHWLRLDAILSQGIGWDHEDLARSMTMLGYRPQSPGPDAAPAALRFWHLARVVSGYPIAPRADLPSEPVAARASLRRLIAAEFERLEALRNDLWAHQDGIEAEAVGRAGLVDTSKEGQLRQRYRREAFSEMSRGIGQVTRMRAERSKDLDRQARRAGKAVPRPPIDGGRGEGDIAASLPSAPTITSPDDEAHPREPSRPVAHRNEPPGDAPDTTSDRLKPRRDNQIRHAIPADAPAAVRRTEPRSSATPPRPEGDSAASSPPDGAPPRPVGADRRP